MKLFLILLSAYSLHAQFTNVARRIEFDYPTNKITPSTAVYIVGSTNVALVTTGITVGVVTNLAAVNSVPILLNPPEMFFAAKASNEWGEVWSETLITIPPVGNFKIRIK